MRQEILEGFGQFAQRSYVDAVDGKLKDFGEYTSTELSRKANRSDLPLGTPLWQSLNPYEDCSFPRVELNRMVKWVNSPTGPGPNVNDHTHSVSSQQAPFYTPGADLMEITFIRCSRDRDYNQVGLMVGKAPLPIKGLSISVYRVDVAEQKLVHLHTEANMNAWMTPGQADLRWRLPVGLDAYLGEVFAVGLRQSGSGNTRPYAGVETETFEVPYDLFPKALTAVASYSSGVDIPFSALSWTSWTPWVSLGSLAEPLDFPALGYSDDFQRPNSPDLGPNWSTYGPMEILDGDVRRWNSGSPAQSGALWVQPLNYDDHEVECVVGSFVQGGLYQVPSWLVLRSNSEFTSGLAVQFVDASFRFGLARITGFNTTSTALATAASSVAIQPGQTIKLTAVGNRYRVYQNGVLRIDWTDTTGQIPTGPQYRFCGFYVQCVDAVFSNRPSTHIGSWAARDITS